MVFYLTKKLLICSKWFFIASIVCLIFRDGNSHRNIVPLLQLFANDNGHLFLVRPYVHGETLQQRMLNGWTDDEHRGRLATPMAAKVWNLE
jgi:serine/threonine protein kinase